LAISPKYYCLTAVRSAVAAAWKVVMDEAPAVVSGGQAGAVRAVTGLAASPPREARRRRWRRRRSSTA